MSEGAVEELSIEDTNLANRVEIALRALNREVRESGLR